MTYPQLTSSSGVSMVVNDTWETTADSATLVAAGAPTNSSESAIVTTVKPGNYVLTLRGKDPIPVGIALSAIYSLN